jgi:hypothetical protein
VLRISGRRLMRRTWFGRRRWRWQHCIGKWEKKNEWLLPTWTAYNVPLLTIVLRGWFDVIRHGWAAWWRIMDHKGLDGCDLLGTTIFFMNIFKVMNTGRLWAESNLTSTQWRRVAFDTAASTWSTVSWSRWWWWCCRVWGTFWWRFLITVPGRQARKWIEQRSSC